MNGSIRHLHRRELRFLGLVTVTAVVIALQVGAGLRLAGRDGGGWRSIDLEALQRRIESGELRDEEADWYHPSTKEELEASGGGA